MILLEAQKNSFVLFNKKLPELLKDGYHKREKSSSCIPRRRELDTEGEKGKGRPMPSRRCAICQNVKQIEDLDLCCSVCQEIELDLLIATYAFIHCQTSEYSPMKEVITQIEPIRGIKISPIFLKNWINKNWLDKNEIDSVRVPPSVRESLEEDGFAVSTAVRKALQERKSSKPKLDSSLEKPQKRNDTQTGRRHGGMIFMQKQKNGN